MRFSFISAFIGLSLPMMAVRGESQHADKKYDIPYRLTDTKHVMVRVKLNGKGPFNFILDTGAPALIMSEKVAKAAGLKSDHKGWSKLTLAVEGGLTLPDAKGVAADMFQLKGMNAMGVAGVELHGVLGYNILARYRITYDFTKDKLTWVDIGFEPPEIVRLNKGDSQGGLEMLGELMKFLAPLLGLKPNFEVQPRGFLGFDVESTDGAIVIKSILPKGPAELAGLKEGDKVLELDNKTIRTRSDLSHKVAQLSQGVRITAVIKRGTDKKTITLETGKGL